MGFSSVSLLFWFGVTLLGGILLVYVCAAVERYANNRRSPRVQVRARIVDKRSEVSGGTTGCTTTTYYLTFQTDDGERREWELDGETFGLLTKGDKGTLTFQGEWFKGFARQRQGKPQKQKQRVRSAE